MSLNLNFHLKIGPALFASHLHICAQMFYSTMAEI